MALRDILQAISDQSDQEIKTFREKHKRTISRLREEHERSLSALKREIVSQREKRKKELSLRAQTYASMQKRNAVLRQKQILLEKIFDDVFDALFNLSDHDIEPLLISCLEKGKNGTIHPSKIHEKLLKNMISTKYGHFTIDESTDSIGGFCIFSEKEEQDFTFKHLVQHVFRPKSELLAAHSLFA